MEPLGVVVGIGIIILMARFFVRKLGWPTTPRALARWCAELVIPLILLPLIPVAMLALATLPVPVVDSPGSTFAFLALVSLLAFALIGFIGWKVDAARRVASTRGIRARLLPRRRALPPAPAPVVTRDPFTVLDDQDPMRPEA